MRIGLIPWRGKQEILHDLLPSSVVRKMRDDPGHKNKSTCETRLVVALVFDLCNFTKISYHRPRNPPPH